MWLFLWLIVITVLRLLWYMAFNIVFSCVVFVIVWLCFYVNLLTDSAVEIYLYVLDRITFHLM